MFYHLGIMQRIVRVIARLMQRTMGTSGVESLCSRKHLRQSDRSTAAHCTVRREDDPKRAQCGDDRWLRHSRGGVMAAYVGFLQNIPGIAGHLVAASIMSAPASLAIMKVIVPEDGTPSTMGATAISVDKVDRNVLEACSRCNGGGEARHQCSGDVDCFRGVDRDVRLDDQLDDHRWRAPLSLSRILGWVFSPIAFAMGVPWSKAGSWGTAGREARADGTHCLHPPR